MNKEHVMHIITVYAPNTAPRTFEMGPENEVDPKNPGKCVYGIVFETGSAIVKFWDGATLTFCGIPFIVETIPPKS